MVMECISTNIETFPTLFLSQYFVLDIGDISQMNGLEIWCTVVPSHLQGIHSKNPSECPKLDSTKLYILCFLFSYTYISFHLKKQLYGFSLVYLNCQNHYSYRREYEQRHLNNKYDYFLRIYIQFYYVAFIFSQLGSNC